MKHDGKPITNPFVVLREEFDDWAILFNPDTGHGFGLSPTGVYVWKLLDGEHSIDDMAKALCRDAENVPEDAGKQIITFIEELAKYGLAGYEGEPGYKHKRRLSHSPEPVKATRFRYEPPALINLSGQGQAAHGDCHFGSQAGDSCWPGNAAPCCYSTGAGGDNFSGCCPGGCPDCTNGNGYCLNCHGGGSPGGYCWSNGASASGGYCSYGQYPGTSCNNGYGAPNGCGSGDAT